MKGLLIKDLKLMKNQRGFLILFLAVGITIFINNPDFALGYLTFIGAMFSMSSISYDEFENGNAFLFSLPITRKGYVKEKYVFTFLASIFSWLVAVSIAGIQMRCKNQTIGQEWFLSAVLIFTIFMLFLLVMLPLHLKFGGEKVKIVIVMIAGIVVLTVVNGMKIVNKNGIDLLEVLNRVGQFKVGTVLLLALAVAGIAFIFSFQISVRIVERKEF